jgi:hypothetical protein
MESELEPLGNALLEPLFLVAKRLPSLGMSVFLLAPKEAEHQPDSACSIKPPWSPGRKIRLGGDDPEAGGCVRGQECQISHGRARQFGDRPVQSRKAVRRRRLFPACLSGADNCATERPQTLMRSAV